MKAYPEEKEAVPAVCVIPTAETEKAIRRRVNRGK